jgi:hypothetical protein
VPAFFCYAMGMTAEKPQRQLIRPTPAWLIYALLVVEGLLRLSERYSWFWFNEKKGWTVLIAVAMVGVMTILMLLWFFASLVFRRRFQFSIRSLLVLTVALAPPCSWLAMEMKKAREPHAAVAAIEELGGVVSYDFQVADHGMSSTAEAPQWKWLRKLLGDDFFNDVIEVGIDETGDRKNVTDDDLECLSALPQLKGLSFGFCPKVTDAGMVHLKGLTKLKSLSLFCSNITDAGLKPIERLTQLEDLQVFCILSDVGLEYLKRLKRLKTLNISCRHLIGEGFIHLKGLTQLQALELYDFDMPEPHNIPLKQIAQLTQLRKLKVNCLHFHPGDVKQLRQALPNCEVNGLEAWSVHTFEP